MAARHNQRAHAILSASASFRWLNCTPSAKLNAEIPDVTTEYAREGTCAHELAEFKVNQLLGIRMTTPQKILTIMIRKWRTAPTAMLSTFQKLSVNTAIPS